MLSTTGQLDLIAMEAALSGATIGHTIEHWLTLPSTMPAAHQRATAADVRSGTVVVAEEQTAGRGRLQRRWNAPAKRALLLSIILKPPLSIPVQQIPMVAGLAAVDACTRHQPILAGQVGLKWPNDILLGTGMADAAKAGGILVESHYYGNELDHVVIGTGLNVLQRADELPPAPAGAPPPTSLAHFLEKTDAAPKFPQLDRTELLISLCQAWSALLEPSASHDIIDRWRAALWTLGQAVTLQSQSQSQPQPQGQSVESDAASAPIQGMAVDVTDAGELVVEDAEGKRHRFAAGDVSLRSG